MARRRSGLPAERLVRMSAGWLKSGLADSQAMMTAGARAKLLARPARLASGWCGCALAAGGSLALPTRRPPSLLRVSSEFSSDFATEHFLRVSSESPPSLLADARAKLLSRPARLAAEPERLSAG